MFFWFMDGASPKGKKKDCSALVKRMMVVLLYINILFFFLFECLAGYCIIDHYCQQQRKGTEVKNVFSYPGLLCWCGFFLISYMFLNCSTLAEFFFLMCFLNYCTLVKVVLECREHVPQMSNPGDGSKWCKLKIFALKVNMPILTWLRFERLSIVPI